MDSAFPLPLLICSPHFCILFCILDTYLKGLYQRAPGPFGFWLGLEKGSQQEMEE